MSSGSRRVNLQLSYVAHTIQLLEQDVSTNEKSLIQSAYFQFELAVLYYLFELFDGAKKKGVIDGVDFISPMQFVEDAELLPQLTSQEGEEFSYLLMTPTSWLGQPLARLAALRSAEVPFGRNIESKGQIFDTVEIPEQPKADNFISVKNIITCSEEPNIAELKRSTSLFKELLARHRLVNEEY